VMADAYPGVQRTNHAVYLLCGARLSANKRGGADRTVIRRGSTAMAQASDNISKWRD
jgi:hypothetical protein